MTNLEIENAFETDLDRLDNTELVGVTHLANEPGFAEEAGMEFVTAVAVVGLHRTLG